MSKGQEAAHSTPWSEKLERPHAAGRCRGSFVAIDFETANRSPSSACAIGLVQVEHGLITRREIRLIRPPTSRFAHTQIHGIDWQRVTDARPFEDVWSDLEPVVACAPFLVAHNAGFDLAVLHDCCRRARILSPPVPVRCSMQLARETWGIHPATLPNVCSFLGISLEHHDPLSDAEACARIVLAATSITIPAEGRC